MTAATDFNGTDSRANAGDVTFLDSLSTFSWAALVYVDTTTSDNTVWEKTSSGYSSGLAVFRDDDRSGQADIWEVYYDDGSNVFRIAPTTTNAGSVGWYFISGWFDAGSSTGLSLYVNGTEADTSPVSMSTASSFPSTANSLLIGHHNGNTRYFNGAMQYVCWWNERLTEGEILALHKAAHPLLIRPEAILHLWESLGQSSPQARIGTDTWTYNNVSQREGRQLTLAQPVMVTRDAATGVTATPGVGTLTLTGIAPTVRLTLRRQPGVGALTLTGVAPTVSVTSTATVTPTVGTLTLSGVAPTVRLTLRRQPGVGTLTLTGLAPTVQLAGTATVTPSVGTITLTGVAPTVRMTLRRQPAVGSLTLTGVAPTVTVEAPGAITVAPAVGTLTLTGVAPTVSMWLRRQPGVGALTLTGIAPSVSVGRTVSPSVGTLTLTGVAPTVRMTLRRQPSVGSLTLTGLAPSQRMWLRRSVGVGTATLTGIAPTVSVTTPTGEITGLADGYVIAVEASDRALVVESSDRTIVVN